MPTQCVAMRAAVTVAMLISLLAPITLRSQVPTYVPTNGLIGWWPFSGNANDVSGNGNDGTLTGVTFGTDRVGATGRAGVFDSLDRVSIPIASAPAGNEARTIACWVYSDDFSMPDRFIAGFPIRSAQQSFALTVLRCCPSDLALWGMDYDYPAGGRLTNGSWHFVAAAYENGELRLCIDDSIYVKSSAGFNTARVDFVIGCFEPANSVLWSIQGKIDDVGLWSRALTNQELRSLYSAKPYAAPSYVPTNDLIGWWPFNGNANDESGNGNDGTVTGAFLTKDRDGVANSAYTFDGIDDVIQTPNQTLTGSVSFSGWYKMSSFNTPGNDMFYVSNQSMSSDIYSANIAFGFRSYQGEYGHSTYIPSPLTGYYATNNLPTTDVWHHIVCVYEKGAYVRMYLDTVLIYQNTNVITNPSQASLPLLIGGTGTSSYYYYDGELDDVGVWNRALTQDEVKALYTGQSCNVTVTSQPQNSAINAASKAVIDVSVTSDTVVTYNWQFNNGAGFVDVSDGTSYTGSKTSQLTIVSMSTATQGDYRCVISTSRCAVTSQTATISLASVGVPSYVPTNGLIGWWPFNGNANDESGNGHNGLASNGVQPSVDRHGVNGSSYLFDGQDDKIRIDVPVPIGSAPRTVSSWFRTTDNRPNPAYQYPELRSVTAYGNGEGGKIIFIQLIRLIDSLGYGQFESGSGGDALYSKSPLNDGLWHHIVSTYSGSGSTVKLYVDGQLQGESDSIELITAQSELGVGYCPWSSIYFKGDIDEIGLWDRALTESEIQGLYTGVPCSITITSNPSSKQALSSQSVVLQVAATADTALTYTWQVKTGAAYVDVVDGAAYAGSKTPQLTIVLMSAATQGDYRCVVSTAKCSLTSEVATVTLKTVNLPAYVPVAGLVGWWPFNGNADDESGNSHHAIATEAQLTENRFDQINSAYRLDGIDDNLFVRDSLFDLSWSDWTMSLWYSLDVDARRTALMINSAPHWGVAIGVGTGTKYRFGVGDGVGSWPFYDPSRPPTKSDYVVGEWKHVIVVKRADNVTFYVDGVLDSTITINGTPTSRQCQLYFGQAHLYGENLKGKLDDIGVWNRAIDAAEVLALFSGRDCALTIQTQPSSDSVLLNESVQLRVAATADTAISYTWQVDNGTGFSDLNDGVVYSGTTTSQLIITSMSAATQGDYRCVVSTAKCSIASLPATVTLKSVDTLQGLAVYPIDFGSVPSDQLINSAGGHVGSVRVKNVSGTAVELIGATVSDTVNFVVPDQWPRRLKDGEEVEVAIRFLPSGTKPFSASLTIRTSDSYGGRSTVAGVGRSLAADERVTQVMLRPSRTFVEPGDTLSVELYVGVERPVQTAGAAGRYLSTIQWDYRVLEPLPSPGMGYDTTGTYAIANVGNGYRQQNQPLLYRFRFRAKQAEVDSTSIIFSGAKGFVWQDDRKAYPALVDSVVRVRVCRDGGPQLVGRVLPARIVRATPTPARDAVDVELNLTGTSASTGTIDIVTADGRRVKTHNVNQHTKNLRIDLTDLSAGIYTIMLTTSTGADHISMVVVP